MTTHTNGGITGPVSLSMWQWTQPLDAPIAPHSRSSVTKTPPSSGRICILGDRHSKEGDGCGPSGTSIEEAIDSLVNASKKDGRRTLLLLETLYLPPTCPIDGSGGPECTDSRMPSSYLDDVVTSRHTMGELSGHRRDTDKGKRSSVHRPTMLPPTTSATTVPVDLRLCVDNPASVLLDAVGDAVVENIVPTTRVELLGLLQCLEATLENIYTVIGGAHTGARAGRQPIRKSTPQATSRRRNTTTSLQPILDTSCSHIDGETRYRTDSSLDMSRTSVGSIPDDDISLVATMVGIYNRDNVIAIARDRLPQWARDAIHTHIGRWMATKRDAGIFGSYHLPTIVGEMEALLTLVVASLEAGGEDLDSDNMLEPETRSTRLTRRGNDRTIDIGSRDTMSRHTDRYSTTSSHIAYVGGSLGGTAGVSHPTWLTAEDLHRGLNGFMFASNLALDAYVLYLLVGGLLGVDGEVMSPADAPADVIVYIGEQHAISVESFVRDVLGAECLVTLGGPDQCLHIPGVLGWPKVATGRGRGR